MRIDLGWTEDSRDPLWLTAPIDRTLPVQRDDVGAVLKALSSLGYYDPEQSGIPAHDDRDVFDAIERFQADDGLERDGVMQPSGPTLFKLNQIFERRREEKFWRQRAEDAARRQAHGWPLPVVMTGLNDAVAGPHPAAEPADELGDTNPDQRDGRMVHPLLAQSPHDNRRRTNQQRGGTPSPAQGRPSAAERAAQRRIDQVLRDPAGVEEPPSRDPQPPWPVPASPPPQQIQVRLRRRTWSALRGQSGDPEHPARAIGPRLAEGLQVFFAGEGGARQASGSSAYAGVLQSTLDRVRTRLDRTDPELAAQLRGLPVAQLTPQQWALVLRDELNEALGRAGGVEALEDIGDRAPHRQSRELAATLVTFLLREHGAQMTRRLQSEINAVMGTLPQDVRARMPARMLAELPVTGVLSPQTRDAIIALVDAGYAESLRLAIVRRLPRDQRYDRDRMRWLESLRFVH